MEELCNCHLKFILKIVNSCNAKLHILNSLVNICTYFELEYEGSIKLEVQPHFLGAIGKYHKIK